MSDEINDTADISWDNVEDTAPTMEEGATEDAAEMDEWDALGAESESAEAKDNDNDESVQDSDSDSGQSESETREATEATDGTEEEADSASVEIPENLAEMGLVSNEGELGKMVKVDGEEQFVSLKDLGNDYSGQKAISQRFNDFDRKEKEFNSQMQEVNDYINDLGATMRDQSILGGVQKIGELVGMAPHELKEALIREIAPELERRYGLSEEELALEYQRSENDYLRQKSESDNQKLRAEQAQRELDDRVYGLREAHNISNQEWVEHEKALANSYSKEEITPELVARYHTFKQAETRADSLIDSFDPSYKDNSEVMESLLEQIIDYPDLTDDDFRDILESALGSSKKEEAEKKVEKTIEAKKKEPKKKEEGDMFEPIKSSEGIEFDDWEDIL